jgi:hypothetical protein
MTDRDPLEWLIGIIGMRMFTARFLCLVRGAFFLLSVGSQIASESEYDRGRGEQLIPTH